VKKQPVKYRDGREVKAPRGITAAQLQIMHDAYYPAENITAEERALRASQLVKAHDAQQADPGRRLGTKNSVEARQHPERDRRIHDAHAKGRTPKQIAGDPKIRGSKKLSASQIRRILKAPRP
jgi:hypothetical protein